MSSIKEKYYAVEDKWYDFLDSLDAKGIAVYKVVDPLEDRGVPSLVAFVSVLIILAALLLSALGFGPAPAAPEAVGPATLQICVKDANTVAPVYESDVYIKLDDGTEKTVKTGADGCAFSDMSIGSSGTFSVKREGYVDSVDFSFTVQRKLEVKTVSLYPLAEEARVFYMTAYLEYDYLQYPEFNVTVRFFDNQGKFLNETTKILTRDEHKIAVEVPSGAFSFKLIPHNYFSETVLSDVKKTVWLSLDALERMKHRVTVSVIDEDGLAITNCSAVFYDKTLTEQNQIVCTNAGTLDLDLPKNTEYSFVISAPGFEDYVSETYELVENKDFGTIVLQRTENIVKLVVRDEVTLAALDDVDVFFFKNREIVGEDRFSQEYEKALGQNTYVAVLWKNGYLRELVTLTPQDTEKEVLLKRASVDNSGIVQVCVNYQATSDPVSGAKIFLMDENSYYMAPRRLSGPDGCFKFYNVSEGTVYAKATYMERKGETSTKSVAAGTVTDLLVYITPVNHTLSVKVLTPEGEPARNAEVVLFAPDGKKKIANQTTSLDGESFFILPEGGIVFARATYKHGSFVLRAESNMIYMLGDREETIRLSNATGFSMEFRGIRTVTGEPIDAGQKLSVGQPYLADFAVTFDKSVSMYKAHVRVGDKESVLDDMFALEAGSPLWSNLCNPYSSIRSYEIGATYTPGGSLLVSDDMMRQSSRLLYQVDYGVGKFVEYEWGAQDVGEGQKFTKEFCVVVRPKRTVTSETPLKFNYKAWFNLSGFERWTPQFPFEGEWRFAPDNTNTDYTVYPGDYVCDGDVCWELAYVPAISLREAMLSMGATADQLEDLEEYSYPVNPENRLDFFTVGQNESFALSLRGFYEGVDTVAPGEGLLELTTLGNYSTITSYEITEPSLQSEENLALFDLPIIVNPIRTGVSMSAIQNNNFTGKADFMSGGGTASHSRIFVKFKKNQNTVSEVVLNLNVLALENPFTTVEVLENGEPQNWEVTTYSGVMFSGNTYDVRFTVKDRFDNPIENAVIRLKDDNPRDVSPDVGVITSLKGTGEEGCGKDGVYLFSACMGHELSINPNAAGTIRIVVGGDAAGINGIPSLPIIVLSDNLVIKTLDGREIGHGDVLELKVGVNESMGSDVLFENQRTGSIQFNVPSMTPMNEYFNLLVSYDNNTVLPMSSTRVNLAAEFAQELSPSLVPNGSIDTEIEVRVLDPDNVWAGTFRRRLKVRVTYEPPPEEYVCTSELVCTKYEIGLSGKSFDTVKSRQLDLPLLIQKGEEAQINFTMVYLKSSEIRPPNAKILLDAGRDMIIKNAVLVAPGEGRVERPVVDSQQLLVNLTKASISSKKRENSVISGSFLAQAKTASSGNRQKASVGLYSLGSERGSTSFDYKIVPILANLSITEANQPVESGTEEYLAILVTNRDYDIRAAMMDRYGLGITTGSVSLDRSGLVPPGDKITCRVGQSSPQCSGLTIRSVSFAGIGNATLLLESDELGVVESPPLRVLARSSDLEFYKCTGDKLTSDKSNCEFGWERLTLDEYSKLNFYIDGAQNEFIQLLRIVNRKEVNYSVETLGGYSEDSLFMINASRKNLTLPPGGQRVLKLLASPYSEQTVSLPSDYDTGEFQLVLRGEDELGVWDPETVKINYYVESRLNGNMKRSESGKTMTVLRLLDQNGYPIIIDPDNPTSLQSGIEYILEYQVFYISDEILASAIHTVVGSTVPVDFSGVYNELLVDVKKDPFFVNGCTVTANELDCPLGTSSYKISGRENDPSFVEGSVWFSTNTTGPSALSLDLE